MLFNHAWCCGVGGLWGCGGCALQESLEEFGKLFPLREERKRQLRTQERSFARLLPSPDAISASVWRGKARRAPQERASVKDVTFWRSIVAGPLFLHQSEVRISLYFHNSLTGIKCSWPVRTRSKRGADKHNCYLWCAYITLNAFTTQMVYALE